MVTTPNKGKEPESYCRTTTWGLSVIAFYALINLLFALPSLVEGRVLAPVDGIGQNLPVRALVAEALRQGELPFWNPYIFCGAPLLATIHPGVLFPGNWLFLFLPPVTAMNLTLLLALTAAGSGTYLFCREIGGTRIAALFGGLTFMLSGFLTMHVAHISMVQVVALMPFALWAIERFRQTSRRTYAAIGSVLIALMVLGGHPQMAAYGMVLSAAYVLWSCRSVIAGRRWSFLGTLALMAVFGIGMASVQLLPTVDFIRETQRSAITYAQLTFSSMPPAGVVALLSPYLFGAISPANGFPTSLWMDVSTLAAGLEGYVGVIGLTLALAALGAWREDSRVRFWAVVGVVTLVLAMGHHTPLYLLWAKLPVLNSMPYASRHFMVFTFAAAVLASLTLSRLETSKGMRSLALALVAVGLGQAGVLTAIATYGQTFAARTQPLLPGSVSVNLADALRITQPAIWAPSAFLGVAVLVALGFWKFPVRRWPLALLLVGLVDLGLHWQLQSVRNPEAPGDLRAASTVDWSEGRSLTIYRFNWPYPVATLREGPAPFERLVALRVPTLGVFTGHPSVDGYDAFIYKRYGTLMGISSAGGFRENERLWSPSNHVLDLAGLRTVYLDPELSGNPFWTRSLAPPRFRSLGVKDGLPAYENLRAMPRAWRVERASVLTDEEVVRRLQFDPRFEPRREALLEAPLAHQALTGGAAVARTASLNLIQLDTTGAGPGLVVVSESFDSGWRAFAEGRELPVHRTDAFLLSVEVPAGRQQVELRYEPRFWRVGVFGSGLALSLLLAFLVVPRRRPPSATA